MKKIFIAVAAALSLMACNKEADPSFKTSEGDLIDINVSINTNVITKANSVTADGEKTVNTLQVYVFRVDANMALDVCGMASANSLDLKCSTGERKIYALVNAPDIRGSVSCEADLLGATTLLSDNTSPTNLVMIGNVTKTLTTPGEPVNIDVIRIASSIAINKISTNFISDALNAGEFKVTDIYLLNVNGKNNYALSSESQAENDWYHRLSKTTNAFPTAGMVSDLGINTVVTKSTAYDKVHTFYAYPNSQSYVASNTWSTRATLLVVECSFKAVGGTAKTYYYPIPVEGLASNKKYIIPELIVTRLGSDDPAKEITFADCTFSVTVQDWDETTLSTETI